MTPSDVSPPTRSEWRFAVTIALVTLLLANLPYLVALVLMPDDQVYNGLVLAVEDGYSYLAKLEQGASGFWRFHLPFTTEPHEPVFTYVFYLALGQVMGWLGAGPLPFLHVSRLVAGFVLLLAIYRLIAAFFTDVSDRRLAYFLAIFGSGFGWLTILITGQTTMGGQAPVEFWLTEMYTFFSVMLYPHFAVAMTLLLFFFSCTLQYFEQQRWTRALVVAGCAVGLSTIHPFMLLVADATIGLFWLRQTLGQRRIWWTPLPGLLLLGLAPVPLVVLQYAGLTANPVMAAWQEQNLTTSPPPFQLALGYGILLLLALPGGWWASRQRSLHPAAAGFSRWPLLPLWVLVVAFLVYMPAIFGIQRRFTEGVHVPVAMLAAAGLRYVVQPAISRSRLAAWLERRGYGGRRLAHVAGLLLVALALPSTLLLLVVASTFATRAENLRFSRDEIAAVSWIKSHTEVETRVLSSYEVGGYVPAHTGRRSFMGHWAETIDVKEKVELAEAFYAGEEGASLLRLHAIDYVFYGPREREMGRALDNPPPYLDPVFSQGSVTLFQVAE